MALCNNCGYKLSPDFKFCPQCVVATVEKPSQAQPLSQIIYGIPLSRGEQVLHRDEKIGYAHAILLIFKDIFVLTSRQIIVVRDPKAWFDEREKVLLQIPLVHIRAVEAVYQSDHSIVRMSFHEAHRINPGSGPNWGFFSYGTDLRCWSHAQAENLVKQISRACITAVLENER